MTDPVNSRQMMFWICAFCGVRITKKNTSGEHIWPDWLKEYVPRVWSHTRHAVSYSQHDNAEVSIPSPKKGRIARPGDPHSQKLRIVCQQCNNGWMSILQERVKPILIPFLENKWPDLDETAQTVLAAWSTMFTMVVEFAHPETMATTQAEREHFKKEMRPAEDWAVWIGNFSGVRWDGVFNHFAFSVSLTEVSKEKVPPTIALAPNDVQVTAFKLGSLFFLTRSVRPNTVSAQHIPFINNELFATTYGLRLIWPIGHTMISAPNKILGDFDADRVSRALLPKSLRLRQRYPWVYE